MQQVTSTSVDKFSSPSYIQSNQFKRELKCENDPYIHKTLFSKEKAAAFDLYNNFLTCFPKGFAGSKDSNFYEYLSMGKVPYILGGATFIAMSCLANSKFQAPDCAAAKIAAKNVAAGVILYALGKFIAPKLSHLGIQASTGVDLDMRYLNKTIEKRGDKDVTVKQYPGVFDSIDFYRSDLLEKDGELNYDNNIYAYYDKIAKKAGYQNKLNAPNQVMGEKIRKLKAKSTALDNIGKYIVATLGVAIGAQKAIKDINISKQTDNLLTNIIENTKDTFTHLGKACKELWNGNEKNIFTKYAGKALFIASAAAIVLNWLIPTKSFKTKPNTMIDRINEKKEYEVC